MEWNWLKDEGWTALKWAGSGLAVWGIAYFKKRAKPFYQNLLRFLRLTSKVEELETSIISSKRRIEVVNNLFLAKLRIDESPIFITDNKGQLEFVNNAWLKTTGFNDPQDAYGEGYMLAIPDTEQGRIQRLSQRNTNHPAPFSGEITFQNIHTGDIIQTFCRTEIVRDELGVFSKTIGRLDILAVKPKL